MKKKGMPSKITMADLGNHIACPFCKEKDKRIKELKQKVQELQELDNKRAFRLYCMLYDMLEKQDPENVASRIDYLTGKDYSDICELYKIAKNIKQHDKELVAKVLEKVRGNLKENILLTKNDKPEEAKLKLVKSYSIDLDVLDQIQKEFENE